MGYCNVAQVRPMLKVDALSNIIGQDRRIDEPEREELLQPIIEGAISDAEAEIDGYLAKRYPVPLIFVPQVINKYAKDITIYNLMSRSGIDENDKESIYLTRYKAAIKYLELVSKGNADIGITSSSTKALATTGFQMHSNKKLFSRNSMKGM